MAGNIAGVERRTCESADPAGCVGKLPLASESRIRDVDMATEMVNFTKMGILQQAGQAILAQANQAPSGILSLLR